jgi:hypothetical protein
LAVNYIQGECDKRYGFHTDPKQPIWKNKILDNSTPPAGSRGLIGLGLKFCIQQPAPQPEIQSTMTRLASIIRIRQHTMTLPQNKDDSEYIPSLYINSSWIPSRARNEVEQGITSFEHEIEKQLNKRTPNRQTNLTHYQLHALK